jgi:hypothetical protein
MANVQVGYGHSDVVAEPFDYNAPLTGATVNMQTAKLALVPAGTIATLTVNLPLNPPDGALAEISSTQVVTAITVAANTGDVILNGVLGAASTITPTAQTGGSAIAVLKYRYTLFGSAGANAPPGTATSNARTWIRIQ